MDKRKNSKTLVEEFIENNSIDLTGVSSELNGNCVILAGFICHVLDEKDLNFTDGKDLISSLGFEWVAEEELLRVFAFAYNNNYDTFWRTKEAKNQYVF